MRAPWRCRSGERDGVQLYGFGNSRMGEEALLVTMTRTAGAGRRTAIRSPEQAA